MDPDALDTARKDRRQYDALNEVSGAIQKSSRGPRPETAALSTAAQPAEAINPKQLAGKFNSLYNDGVLQTALGDHAHALLDHTGSLNNYWSSLYRSLYKLYLGTLYSNLLISCLWYFRPVITTEKADVIECRCERCGHKWIPALAREKGKLVQAVPIACSACKSAYWNRPRIRRPV